MAGQIPDLIAKVRTGTGKGAARQARREGNVPGIVYGDGKEPQAINLDYYYLLKRLKAGRFLQTLFNLKVEGQPDAHVICRGVQRDVVKDLPTHVDFMRIHDESRIVGDSLPTLYSEEGNVRIELTDPGCIAEPAYPKPLERMCRTSHKLNGWWHGVHTVYSQAMKRDDVTRPLGYHAVFDRLGEQWDYLPASRVEHVKRNVPRLARVGYSDFKIVQTELESSAKLRRNTAEGAAILAAIVMIRQHAEGVSKGSIERFVSENATSSATMPPWRSMRRRNNGRGSGRCVRCPQTSAGTSGDRAYAARPVLRGPGLPRRCRSRAALPPACRLAARYPAGAACSRKRRWWRRRYAQTDPPPSPHPPRCQTD